MCFLSQDGFFVVFWFFWFMHRTEIHALFDGLCLFQVLKAVRVVRVA